MLAGVAEGVSTIRGLLEGEDVLCTVAALQALGAKVVKEGDGWRIEGIGLEGLRQAAQPLDMGNSGTSTRLLMGLLGGRPLTTVFTGDASLCKRPMGRVMAPLEQMGATFESADGRLPITVKGAAQPKAITYRLPVASAQVKSAVLLAGLSAEGVTTVIEAIPTRDHTERLLRHFGASVSVSETGDGAEAISVNGLPRLHGQSVSIPADISSAAFPIVAALLRPDSAVTLQGVGVNPRRAGIILSLQEMEANITLTNVREDGGEPVADIVVQSSALRGVDVPSTRAPSMIDEYPVLAMAAACAEGTSRFRGLSELRVKESDRLALIAQGLKACGVRVEIEGDDLIVHGAGQPPVGGATVATAMDHRIAMSFLVLGAAAREPVRIDDARMISTSFPGFAEAMNRLGADVR